MSNLFLFLFQGAATPFVHSNSSLDYLKLWTHLLYTTINYLHCCQHHGEKHKEKQIAAKKTFQ